MSQYPQRAGKKYESDLMKLMRSDGYDVERLRLTGAEDEGDLLLRIGSGLATDFNGNPFGKRVVIEAKREKGFNLAGWIKEAEVERDNYARHRGIDMWQDPTPIPGFVVVHYARGKPLSKSYVTTTLDEWLKRL